jgi:hypothetical protein
MHQLVGFRGRRKRADALGLNDHDAATLANGQQVIDEARFGVRLDQNGLMFPTQDLEQDAIQHLEAGVRLVLPCFQACSELGFEGVQPLERCVNRIGHRQPQWRQTGARGIGTPSSRKLA